MATHSNITTSTNPVAIPSVYDLTRHIAAVWLLHHKHDLRCLAAADGCREMRAAHEAMTVTLEEIEACGALIMALPIKTMADAAALASQGFIVVDCLSAEARTEKAGLSDEMLRLRRVFARLTILTAEAAGIDTAELRDVSHTDRLLRFAGAAPVEAGEDVP